MVFRRPRLVRCAVAAALALAALRAPARAAESEGRVTLADQATVVGKTIRLGELGDLEGSAAAFADLDLGPAPEPGGMRRLAGASVLRRLRVAGFDAEKNRYEIPAAIRVTRASQEIAEAEIKNAILADGPSWLGAGQQISAIEVSGVARAGAGGYEIRVPALKPAVGSIRRFDVEIVQDGAVVAAVPARVSVSARGAVVVVRRPVARGAEIAPEDVDLEERAVGASSAGLATDTADVVGKEARIALSPGSPVDLKALQTPAAVKRGDRITLLIETAGLRLRAPGEALESAAVGARVRVVNTSSRRELSGQVVGHGVVAVAF